MAEYSTTPLAQDAYSRYQIDVFDEKTVIGVPTAFQTFFGRPGAKTLYSPDAAVVDIDIIRGNERLAALIPRGIQSRPLGATQKNTNVQKFSNFNRVYPLGEEEGDIDANQLLLRRAGENPYEGRTRIQRMREHAMDHHQEHVRRFVRMFEYLCTQSVLEGKMPAILGTSDTNLLYDFRRNSANIITVGTVWTDPAADILGDIDTGCGLIRSNGHMNADMITFSDDAFAAFLVDADVIAKADNRRFEMIEVSTNNPVPSKFAEFVAGGFIPRGRLRTPGGYDLWMFTYIDGYTDSGGTFTKYMPSGYVSICASDARCDRYFGPPEKLPDVPARDQLYQQMFGFSPDAPPMPPKIKGSAGVVNASMFYFDAYTAPDWKSLTIRTQTAPIFATTQTDAFVTLKGTV